MKENKARLENVIKSVIKKSIMIVSAFFSNFLYGWASKIAKAASGDSDALESTFYVQAHQDRESLFKGWFNNRMTVLLMLIEHRKQRKPKMIMRINFFLDDLKHHYMATLIDDSISEAFDYLHEYLAAYPGVSAAESQNAKRMINRIYQTFGYDKKIIAATKKQRQDVGCYGDENLSAFQKAALLMQKSNVAVGG